MELGDGGGARVEVDFRFFVGGGGGGERWGGSSRDLWKAEGLLFTFFWVSKEKRVTAEREGRSVNDEGEGADGGEGDDG